MPPVRRGDIEQNGRQSSFLQGGEGIKRFCHRTKQKYSQWLDVMVWRFQWKIMLIESSQV